MAPLIAEYREDYPDIPLYARGHSGFATPELYGLFEDSDVKYKMRWIYIPTKSVTGSILRKRRKTWNLLRVK